MIGTRAMETLRVRRRVDYWPETDFDGFPRIVIDLPTEADSHRCELDRSPGLRFFGTKLPSQRLSASGGLLLRSSTLTVAGAAPELHRLPLRHQVAFFIS
jgi:hypothetical protein